MEELPEGWSSAKFDDLFARGEYGTSVKCDYNARGIAVLRIPNIAQGTISLEDLKFAAGPTTYDAEDWLDQGDLLMCRTNGSVTLVGKTALVRKRFDIPVAFASYLLRFRFFETEWLPRWVDLFFNSSVARDFIEKNAASSAGQHNISLSLMRNVSIPLPPVAEQKQIVAKVEALLSNVNAVQERLAKVPTILKRFRQAVLAAACSGRLTEDWREENGTQISPQKLQGELLDKRREAFQEKYAGGNHQKYREPLEMDSCALPGVTEAWLWTSADAVCSQVTDGEHIQPPYQPDGFPMLTATHVRDGFVNFENYRLISEDAFRKSLTRCAPTENDILIVSVGATTGRSAIVRKCPAFAIVRSVLLLRPIINPDFLLRWTQSSWCFNWMSTASGASAQPHLYINDVRRMPVPVPPLPEQQEIVRRVDALFALADRIEAKVSAATARAEKLTQAILAKAFRGELVPTEAKLARQEGRDYEPASVLLERIKAERAAQEPAKKRRKTSSKPE